VVVALVVVAPWLGTGRRRRQRRQRRTRRRGRQATGEEEGRPGRRPILRPLLLRAVAVGAAGEEAGSMLLGRVAVEVCGLCVCGGRREGRASDCEKGWRKRRFGGRDWPTRWHQCLGRQVAPESEL